ncbi:MAG: 50S ribosomal protein L21e [Candidatus Altiarchaeota archaeon]
MKGSSGYRRRTRNLKVGLRERGKVKIRRRLTEFEENQDVSIKIDPSYQKMPHPRFKGRTGKVVGRQGRSYFVKIIDGGKTKKILVQPEHLNKVG